MIRVVAVTARRGTTDGRERVLLNAAYVAAVSRAGLVPVVIPPMVDPSTGAATLDRVDGLLLTGGEDVDPSRYRAHPHERLAATDLARDALEIALIGAARRRRLPVLGICRGIQILNVALGGTLYQDLCSERPGPIDHADEDARHDIRVAADSWAHNTLGTTQASVNSRHHQAIRDLAPGLRATAWAADGVIEAVEAKEPDAWMVGIQWHPEDDAGEALFLGFAAALG